MKTGVILIATGEKYHKYITPVMQSIKDNFKPTTDVAVFLFTDAEHKYTEKQFYQPDLGFPGSTLWRFRTILKQEKELAKMDYLYYMDIDMLVVDKIGDEILSDLVATLHPGYVNSCGEYETNPKSLAYVADGEKKQYFCGGFNGGKATVFLKMAHKLGKNIGLDYGKDIVAIWHDESHLNRYMIDNPPTKILSPSYCYPEPPEDLNYKRKWEEEYTPKIYALNKKDRKDKVSIVIPCYKHAQYLSYAIESALAQTYANTEIIVVNDGSPDHTSEVAKRYPVILIEQENAGLSAARNAGLAVATGDYFLPLDADDCIDKDYLMKTVPIMNDKTIGVVYTALKTMDEYHREQDRWCNPPPEIIMENLKHNNQLYVCSLIRMEILRQCGGYNTNMIHGYEDWNLWMGILKKGWKFQIVPEPLFLYMVKRESMATEAFDNWHQWNMEQIKKNHPDVYKP